MVLTCVPNVGLQGRGSPRSSLDFSIQPSQVQSSPVDVSAVPATKYEEWSAKVEEKDTCGTTRSLWRFHVMKTVGVSLFLTYTTQNHNDNLLPVLLRSSQWRNSKNNTQIHSGPTSQSYSNTQEL